MFNSKNEYTMPRLRIAVIIAIIVIPITSLSFGLRSLGFRPFDSATITGLFAQLFLISVFMERAIEFFINVWRETSKQDLTYCIKKNKQTLKELSNSNAEDHKINEKKEEIEVLEGKVHHYIFQTMRISLWLSFLFGILISSVGVRTIEPLVVINLPTHLTTPDILQQNALRLVDIFLTGGLISGGSEGIHKVTTVFNNFMGSTAARVKE